jgi:predicted phosphate transport protein (TIGR00153 family)
MGLGFLNIFASSPFKPLQDHMNRVCACVSSLVLYFGLVFEQKWDKVEEQYQVIAHLEREADKLKRDIRQHMPNSLLMPVSRSDLLDLLSVQDKLANQAKDIAGIIVGRRMCFPESLHGIILDYVRISVKAAQQAVQVGSVFDELLELGFKGHEAERVFQEITVLEGIEKESDRVQIKIRSQLFAMEKELNPVDVVFMYQILEWIGDIADRAQRVGHCIDLLLAH